MIRLAVLIASLLFLFSSIASAQPGSSRYDRVLEQVRKLSDSPHVRLLQFGHSTDGRSIPAFIITDLSVPLERKARIFICAGQHGDEYNPVKSLLALCSELASGDHCDLLLNCVFIVVPMVNPGGTSAQSRLSSDGTDINRDWLGLSTPETWFVDSIIKQWNPHMLIDLHEWTEPVSGVADSIEVPYSTFKSQAAAMSSIAKPTAQDAGLTVIHCSRYSNPALFHRRYTSLRYAAYLIETAYNESYKDKERKYHTAVFGLASMVAEDRGLCAAISPASAHFDKQAVSEYLRPAHKPLSLSSLSHIAVLLGVCYCLMVWLLKLHGVGDESRWNRKFRKCLTDAAVDAGSLRSRRTLQPLTSKSWVHRRLRSRYSETGQNDPANTAASQVPSR